MPVVGSVICWAGLQYFYFFFASVQCFCRPHYNQKVKDFLCTSIDSKKRMVNTSILFSSSAIEEHRKSLTLGTFKINPAEDWTAELGSACSPESHLKDLQPNPSLVWQTLLLLLKVIHGGLPFQRHLTGGEERTCHLFPVCSDCAASMCITCGCRAVVAHLL